MLGAYLRKRRAGWGCMLRPRHVRQGVVLLHTAIPRPGLRYPRLYEWLLRPWYMHQRPMQLPARLGGYRLQCCRLPGHRA